MSSLQSRSPRVEHAWSNFMASLSRLSDSVTSPLRTRSSRSPVRSPPESSDRIRNGGFVQAYGLEAATSVETPANITSSSSSRRTSLARDIDRVLARSVQGTFSKSSGPLSVHELKDSNSALATDAPSAASHRDKYSELLRLSDENRYLREHSLIQDQLLRRQQIENKQSKTFSVNSATETEDPQTLIDRLVKEKFILIEDLRERDAILLALGSFFSNQEWNQIEGKSSESLRNQVEMFVESKIRAECTHHQVVFKRDQEWGWSPIVRKAYDLLLEGISQLVETKNRIGSSSLSNHRLEGSLRDMTLVVSDLSSNIRLLEQRTTGIETSLEESSQGDRNTSIRKDINELEARIRESHEKDALIIELNSIIRENTRNYQDSMNQVRKLESEVDSLRSKLEQESDSLQRCQGEYESTRNTCEKLREERITLQHAVDSCAGLIQLLRRVASNIGDLSKIPIDQTNVALSPVNNKELEIPLEVFDHSISLTYRLELILSKIHDTLDDIDKNILSALRSHAERNTQLLFFERASQHDDSRQLSEELSEFRRILLESMNSVGGIVSSVQNIVQRVDKQSNNFEQFRVRFENSSMDQQKILQELERKNESIAIDLRKDMKEHDQEISTLSSSIRTMMGETEKSRKRMNDLEVTFRNVKDSVHILQQTTEDRLQETESVVHQSVSSIKRDLERNQVSFSELKDETSMLLATKDQTIEDLRESQKKLARENEKLSQKLQKREQSLRTVLSTIDLGTSSLENNSSPSISHTKSLSNVVVTSPGKEEAMSKLMRTASSISDRIRERQPSSKSPSSSL